MSQAVILGRVGAHVLDQLELVLAAASSPGTGVEAGVWLRAVEVAIPFASSDGSDVSPTTVVVGETPLPLSVAREQLLALEQLVLVNASELQPVSPSARGQLVLRVQLPKPSALSTPSNDHNPPI